jgi:hypothetical protein
MNNKHWTVGVLLASAIASAGAGTTPAFPLQPLADKPGPIAIKGRSGKVFYVPSTRATIKWGYLSNAADAPVLTVPSGATVIFDTLSHEGLLEDQGRNPLQYFASKGIPANQVLKDAIAITQSDLLHDFAKDGPHIITGPRYQANFLKPPNRNPMRAHRLRKSFITSRFLRPFGVIAPGSGKV